MKLVEYKGVPHPAKMNRDSWIVVGPPGSGKSHLIQKIGGYSGEVAIDISEKKWWGVEPLTHRPREIHFALPFQGQSEPITVYDERFKGERELPELDFERIRLPQKKKFILAPDWQARFVFDFILPPPAWLFETRRARLSTEDGNLVDMDLTPQAPALPRTGTFGPRCRSVKIRPGLAPRAGKTKKNDRHAINSLRRRVARCSIHGQICQHG